MPAVTMELVGLSKEEVARINGLHLSEEVSRMIRAMLEEALARGHADREGPPLASRVADSQN